MSKAPCSFCGGISRSVASAHTPTLAICVTCVKKAVGLLGIVVTPPSEPDFRRPPTKRQREILDFLSTFNDEHGYMPSFEEIALHFKYASLATVHEHLFNLEVKGYIERNYNEARSIRLVAA